MGGFRSGPLIFMVFGVAPIFLFVCSSPTLACDFLLNPLVFQVTVFNKNTLLPNGMVAIRYPETEKFFRMSVCIEC